MMIPVLLLYVSITFSEILGEVKYSKAEFWFKYNAILPLYSDNIDAIGKDGTYCTIPALISVAKTLYGTSLRSKFSFRSNLSISVMI